MPGCHQPRRSLVNEITGLRGRRSGGGGAGMRLVLGEVELWVESHQSRTPNHTSIPVLMIPVELLLPIDSSGCELPLSPVEGGGGSGGALLLLGDSDGLPRSLSLKFDYCDERFSIKHPDEFLSKQTGGWFLLLAAGTPPQGGSLKTPGRGLTIAWCRLAKPRRGCDPSKVTLQSQTSTWVATETGLLSCTGEVVADSAEAVPNV